MIIAVIVVFMLSLVGLVGLFFVKSRELATGRVYFPQARHVLDAHADTLRARGIHMANAIEHSPAFGVLFLRWLVHVLAVLVALGARSAERQAHRLADFVSYRRHFERRETRSDYLRQVSDHKNGLDKSE